MVSTLSMLLNTEFENEGVGIGTADHVVVARSAPQDVDAGFAIELVVAVAAGEPVDTRISIKVIVACARYDRIVAGTCIEAELFDPGRC